MNRDKNPYAEEKKQNEDESGEYRTKRERMKEKPWKYFLFFAIIRSVDEKETLKFVYIKSELNSIVCFGKCKSFESNTFMESTNNNNK